MNIVGVSLGAQSGDAGESNPSGRSVRIEGDVVSYSPAWGFPWATAPQDTYEDTFFYKVSDGRGGIEVQSVKVTVARPDADLPSAASQDPTPTQDIGANAIAGFNAQSERRGPPADQVVVGSDRSNRIVGNADRDRLEGRGGADQIFGESGDDILNGGSGDDALDGGTGDDDAVYNGSVRDYAIVRSGNGFVVRDMVPGRHGDDGADLVRGIERLRFLDRTVFLDGTNNAPVAEQDTGFVVGDGQLLRIRAGDLLANDRDFDGDRLTIVGVSFNGEESTTSATDPSGRAVRIVGNNVVYTPAEGFQWATLEQDGYEDTFFYTVSDGRGGLATQTATLTVVRPGTVVASGRDLAPPRPLNRM